MLNQSKRRMKVSLVIFVYTLALLSLLIISPSDEFLEKNADEGYKSQTREGYWLKNKTQVIQEVCKANSMKYDGALGCLNNTKLYLVQPMEGTNFLNARNYYLQRTGTINNE